MERNNDAGNRGQVGIGTLIVFIAMVLVAAIAAGVLINTAGFLQTQAEDTGTESTQQVADALNVINEVGEVGAADNGGDDNITEVRLGVQPAAGADDINLADLSIQFLSDNTFEELIVGNDTTEDERAAGETDPDDVGPTDTEEATYNVSVVTAENEDDIVMTDGSDRYNIEIPLYDDGSDWDQGDLQPLQEGEDVQVTITTAVGSQTVAFLQVPDSLVGPDEGETVNL